MSPTVLGNCDRLPVTVGSCCLFLNITLMGSSGVCSFVSGFCDLSMLWYQEFIPFCSWVYDIVWLASDCLIPLSLAIHSGFVHLGTARKKVAMDISEQVLCRYRSSFLLSKCVRSETVGLFGTCAFILDTRSGLTFSTALIPFTFLTTMYVSH
jgi:hypothetical protein